MFESLPLKTEGAAWGSRCNWVIFASASVIWAVQFCAGEQVATGDGKNAGRFQRKPVGIVGWCSDFVVEIAGRLGLPEQTWL